MNKFKEFFIYYIKSLLIFFIIIIIFLNSASLEIDIIKPIIFFSVFYIIVFWGRNIIKKFTVNNKVK